MRPATGLLLAFSLVALAPAAQADTLDGIRARSAIRLGYSETKAPFSFKAKDDGQPAGFSVELCHRVAAAVVQSLAIRSMKVEWVPLDPDTRLDAVAAGRVDLECGTTTATLSRRKQVDFSLPIFADSATLMGRAAVATTIPELQGRRIAVAEGTTTQAALERGLRDRQVKAGIVPTKTLADAFALLKSGKVDAIAGDRTALVGTYLLGGGAEGLSVYAENLSYEPYALALRRGDADFRLFVDSILAGLYRSGEIDAIVSKWLAPLGKRSEAVQALYLLNALPD